jgi:hypothetical protein
MEAIPPRGGYSAGIIQSRNGCGARSYRDSPLEMIDVVGAVGAEGGIIIVGDLLKTENITKSRATPRMTAMTVVRFPERHRIPGGHLIRPIYCSKILSLYFIIKS